MEILSTLGIEWQQLVAQLVNFAILATVLTFLLYRPILRVLDERRERVRLAMENAAKVEEQTREMEKIRKEKLSAIDKEAAVLLTEAKHDVEKKRQEMLTAAEKEAKDLITKAKRDMEQEREQLAREFQGKAAKMIVTLSAKILQREFSAKDQERLMDALEKDVSTSLRA
jgi:F-type H+-transporting ATPase subunit b